MEESFTITAVLFTNQASVPVLNASIPKPFYPMCNDLSLFYIFFVPFLSSSSNFLRHLPSPPSYPGISCLHLTMVQNGKKTQNK